MNIGDEDMERYDVVGRSRNHRMLDVPKTKSYGWLHYLLLIAVIISILLSHLFIVSLADSALSEGPYNATIIDEATHRPRQKTRSELTAEDRTHLTLNAKAMNDEEDTKVRKSIALKASQDEDETASQDENDLEDVQEELKKLAVNDHDSASPETDLKDADIQLEEQSSEENIAGGNKEPEQAVRGDKAVTKSSAKRKRSAKRKSTPQSKKKQFADPSDDQQNEGNTTGSQKTPEPSTRKSPRTRTETQNAEASATQTSQGTRSGKNPETVAESKRKNFHETPVTPRTPRDQSDFVSPFTIHPRKSTSRSFASNSEVISLLEDLKQHVLLIEEGPTTGAETTPASSSQPKDKGKAPATEESDEDSDEETKEEEDPAQYRLLND
nr:nucleolar protein dao-5-like [Coffea arabica]